jgi:hypothetical protein
VHTEFYIDAALNSFTVAVTQQLQSAAENEFDTAYVSSVLVLLLVPLLAAQIESSLTECTA